MIARYPKSGISIRTDLLEGSNSSRAIAERMVKFSTEKQVDHIVVGNIGLRDISKIKSIGSVSRNLVETSKRPVLGVH